MERVKNQKVNISNDNSSTGQPKIKLNRKINKIKKSDTFQNTPIDFSYN